MTATSKSTPDGRDGDGRDGFDGSTRDRRLRTHFPILALRASLSGQATLSHTTTSASYPDFALLRLHTTHIYGKQIHTLKMSDQFQEILDIPKDFVKDGTMFINRCTKRTFSHHFRHSTRTFSILAALDAKMQRRQSDGAWS